MGCVAVTNLHRKNWFVIRYLAAQNATIRTEVVDKLLSKAVEHARAKNVEYLRATTPSISPYIDIYKQHGFKPVRRDFRMSWDLTEYKPKETDLEIVEVSDETLDSAVFCYIEGLKPYWNWRTEEHGGPEALARSFKEEFKRSGKWIAAQSEKKVVGLAGLVPDYYRTGEARFRGAFVIPESRGRGIGASLMMEIVKLGQSLGQRKMVVYTQSYLDCLAPGALLYLKSGGKIEAEYLQLQQD